MGEDQQLLVGEDQLKELIAAYLQDAKLMQLATSSDEQPWVCNVWFASDDELNVYWFSASTRRHSFEVEKNPLVGAAFALPSLTPSDPPRGLQLQGHASMLVDDADVKRARSVYAGRIFTDEKISELMVQPERPHHFYKIEPTQFVLFDAVNFPDNPRQQLDVYV